MPRSSRCGPCRSAAEGAPRLALGRGKARIALGYRRARSHELIDIDVCPILSPRIVERLPKLKQALAPLLGGKREARVSVTETESGLDIVLEGVSPSPASLGAFAGKAGSLGVARLTVDGESIGPVAAPQIDLSGAQGEAACRAPSSRPRARRKPLSSSWCGKA